MYSPDFDTRGSISSGTARHRPPRLRQGHTTQAQSAREVSAKASAVDGEGRTRPDRGAISDRGPWLPEASEQRAQARWPHQWRVWNSRGRPDTLSRPVRVLPGQLKQLTQVLPRPYLSITTIARPYRPLCTIAYRAVLSQVQRDEADMYNRTPHNLMQYPMRSHTRSHLSHLVAAPLGPWP